MLKTPILRCEKNIGYHIVYKEGSTGLYPFNYLRNVALDNVQTPYVFLCDIDFLPVFGMYQRLQTDILLNMNKQHKKALIVPAFEEKTQFIFDFPKNKQELITQMKERQIIPFRFDSFTYGHQATDYPKWIQATAPYKVKYKAYYEPYMILPKDVPKYDTRFVGWRWDKSSHTMELDADGYELIVLPDLFIIHKLHARTYHRTMFFTSKRYKSCVKIFKEEFLKYLAKKYGKRGEIYQKMYEKDL